MANTSFYVLQNYQLNAQLPVPYKQIINKVLTSAIIKYEKLHNL